MYSKWPALAEVCTLRVLLGVLYTIYSLSTCSLPADIRLT